MHCTHISLQPQEQRNSTAHAAVTLRVAHSIVVETQNNIMGHLCCMQVVPLGGGRIAMDAGRRTAHIYGYSSQFGQAPHCVAAALLRRWYPFHAVTVSCEGY